MRRLRRPDTLLVKEVGRNEENDEGVEVPEAWDFGVEVMGPYSSIACKY